MKLFKSGQMMARSGKATDSLLLPLRLILDFPVRPCGVAVGDHLVGQVMDDDGTGADNGILADFSPRNHRGSRCDKSPVANADASG